LFIVIDGIDGAGKTTLVRQLLAHLGAAAALATKEPTDESEWGRRLRDSATLGRLPREVELDYFHRDRLAHLSGVIRPALASGKIVVCDRYVDSTLAFQADTPAEADALYERFRAELLLPDITFILDCPVDVGLARINRDRKVTSKFEKVETLRKAAAIYAARAGSHYAHLDAAGTPLATFRQAIAILRQRWPQRIATIAAEPGEADPIASSAQHIA
jgi:dTMP kinase